MSNTLQIKRRTSAGVPSGLAAGELAVNLSDNKLYVGNAAANGVIHLNPSASTSYLPLAGGTLTGQLYSQTIRPSANATYNLGVATGRYAYVYGVTGDFSGNLTVSGSCTFAALSGTTGSFSGI